MMTDNPYQSPVEVEQHGLPFIGTLRSIDAAISWFTLRFAGMVTFALMGGAAFSPLFERPPPVPFWGVCLGSACGWISLFGYAHILIKQGEKN